MPNTVQSRSSPNNQVMYHLYVYIFLLRGKGQKGKKEIKSFSLHWKDIELENPYIGAHFPYYNLL